MGNRGGEVVEEQGGGVGGGTGRGRWWGKQGGGGGGGTGEGRWWGKQGGGGGGGNREGEVVGESGERGNGRQEGVGRGKRGRVPQPSIQIFPAPALKNFFLLSPSPLLPSLQA